MHEPHTRRRSPGDPDPGRTSRRLTDIEFEVLNGVAICRVPDVATVAEVVGLREDVVASAIRSAIDRGELTRVRRSMMISTSGRDLLSDEYLRRYNSFRENAKFTEAFDHLEAINESQLEPAISDWQPTRADVPQAERSDDPVEVATITDRFGAIVDQVERTLEPFCEAEPRIRRSCKRLRIALERACAGERDYVTGSWIPSVATVWSQLRTDVLLLTALDRPRP